MSLTKTEFTSHLENFDFRTLFNKMGWNNDKTKHSIVVDDITFNLEAVAEKSGFKILVCSPLPNGSIPEYSQRIKIDQKITKFFQEHLLIFVDKKQTAQLWQLVVRQLLKPITVTPVEWHIKQDIDRLYQRFANVFFELDEEDNITIIDVKSRLRENFQVNNEKVTKKFYDRFKTEHDKFKSFIKGIKEIADLEWYASLMLNRLMFIYFIQKKRFLDGDIHYLKKRLKEVQALKGKDQFHQTFYRYFLLKLFHDGLGKRERNKELEKLIGKIPYLNGGFFEVHEIESRNDNIDIPDEAFEKLFQFFDEFEWHLDTRYHATGKEINPDVVGYIFEKYINQKEKGAYYTKEDITEYISKNTIIPFLFDKSGIDENHPVWQLLQDDPDCYIYNAVKKGVDILLPPEIEVGINDVSQRTDWNKPASSDYALPTETWREHVARRTRCLDIRNKIKSGKVKTVNDLITLNLDIRQLTQDMIFSTDDPEWLWRFYSALDSVTILDPTCGSGAFLFAAMNILEPLYDACLIRMENMPGRLPAKYADVKRKIQSHPNRRYFICKNIILNNLYGVDIMDEAVEICKLRLFLKLAAEVETVDKIEPLPDIDFNIRSGNTLVGYVSLEQIRQSQKNKLTLDDDLQKIELSANNIDGLFRKFRENQTNDQTGFIPHLKQDLRNNLHKLRDQLDHYLANEYNIGLDDSEGFLNWQNSHQPFHWIVEFYGILHNGGFDVVIGNPPYVEYTKVKKEYQIKNYKTEKCGNLYGFIIERAIQISQTNLLGFIIPLAAFGTPSTHSLREMLVNNCKELFVSYWSGDAHPAVLFEGVKLRLSIILSNNCSREDKHNLFTTNYIKWYSAERNFLFESRPFYTISTNADMITFPKIGCKIEKSIIRKIMMKQKTINSVVERISNHKVFYHNAPVFFIRAMNFIPFYKSQNSHEPSSNHFKTLFTSTLFSEFLLGVLNSSTFFLWFTNYSACRDLTIFDIYSFPLCNKGDNIAIYNEELTTINRMLMTDINEKSIIREYNYATGKVEYQEFYMRESKTIIDKIDRVLAQHYGFTSEELDFIINYDIKYRIGGEEEG